MTAVLSVRFFAVLSCGAAAR